MATRSPVSIEQYLMKYGDWSRNKKLALQVGILEANALRPADLNKRLAQRLYELGYCVNESGKLLEETKCPRAPVAPVAKQARVVIGQQRARSSGNDPEYQGDEDYYDDERSPYYAEEETFEFHQPEAYEETPNEYYGEEPPYLTMEEIINRLPKVPGGAYCPRR